MDLRRSPAPPRWLHLGPTQFALADSGLWYATFTLVGLEAMAVTSDLHITFLRPAREGNLHAAAQVV